MRRYAPERVPLRGVTALPYVAGPRFLLETYAAAGMRHVLSVLIRPPSSTSEILHPAHFFRGETPWRGTPDRSAVLSEPLGEALLGVLLERCTGPMPARRLAAAYRGDLATLRRSQDGLRLEWETRWEDEGAAVEASRVLGGCAVFRTPSAHLPISGEVGMAVDDRRLVLVKGMVASDAEASAQQLLRTKGDDVPNRAIPLGGRAPAVDAVVPGVRVDGRWLAETRTYASGTLGLRLSVPAGAKVFVPSPSGVITVIGESPRVFASFSAFRSPGRSDFVDALVDVALAGVEQDGQRFEEVDSGDASLGGIPSKDTTWRRQNEWLRLRRVDLCQGKVLVLLLARWSDAAGKAAADRFESTAWWAADRDCELPAR